ncbi:MAG: decapping endonuclease targeting mRNA [Trizodia sp. TS-e1964]|nr:MAG: decapping endonuclease targeting mRNA [Trizodia sp. TS-e1964]
MEAEPKDTERFQIQPVNRFAGVSAAIKRPQEIASFSFDENHEYRYDESSLRYYYHPEIGVDLSKGYDTFRKLENSADLHLDALLKTLVNLESAQGAKCGADFITWRGMMTKV